MLKVLLMSVFCCFMLFKYVAAVNGVGEETLDVKKQASFPSEGQTVSVV